ncbi:YhgE/Pip domain-containing protein [Deinococcus sp. HMF7604]|uniref:YhgE/Pip domain-containing protein n=1 Tax=Deinococcus betulae TaxID=2873312 RepID=UPI001CCCBF59|nr:YhgE/Pip domain-containing protein [Deinococcus betulae]MBZ9749312.1 YhgE/Pip domain-containing protein [Deinococcus betulae]
MTRPPARLTVRTDYRALTPAERSLWRAPLMWASAALFLFIPIIYVTVYLLGVWDPAGQLPQLPAALVNLDQGIVQRGKRVNVGHDLVTELRRDPPVDFRRYPTQAAAEEAVRRGEVYFALTIPAEFSRKAVGGRSSEHGLLRLYRAPGLNAYASAVADRVAGELAETLNRDLGERRWEVVQSSLKDVQQGFADLRAATGDLVAGAERLSDGAEELQSGAATLTRGAGRLASGSADLATGAGKLAGGVSTLTGGVGRLSGSLRQLEAAAPTSAEVALLKEGARALSAGTGQLAGQLEKLAAGSGDLATAARTLTGGAAQVGTGSARLAKDLPALAGGLNELQAGATELGGQSGTLRRALPAGQPVTAGAARLEAGAQTLAQGLTAAGQGAQQAATGAAALAKGAAQVQGGAARLQQGTQTLVQGSRASATGAGQLAGGAAKVQTGVTKLADGSVKLGAALGQINRKVPAQAELTKLSSGADQLAQSAGVLAARTGDLAAGSQKVQAGATDLASGAGQLADGLARLRREIPATTEDLGGDPEGLAQSVQVRTQTFADVPNNGNAFAPYFVALALWVGVTMTTFIFPYLLLPASGRQTSQAARVLRKLAQPGLIVLGQALLVVAGLHLLDVHLLSPALVVLTALAASLTFLLVVVALNLLFGPAGRVLALILLIVQLAASGGSYPVELSGPVFQAIHTVIPVTAVVNALRAAMFGAFEGQYWVFMGHLALVAAVSLGVALLSRRRWVYTPDDRFRSPILTDVG